VCGAYTIQSSGWTGIETCPGIVDQEYLEEIKVPNAPLLYFTNLNRKAENITASGIYVQVRAVTVE
jgi:hypothetical protein